MYQGINARKRARRDFIISCVMLASLAAVLCSVGLVVHDNGIGARAFYAFCVGCVGFTTLVFSTVIGLVTITC